VGTARFTSRSTGASKGSTNNGADVSPRLASFSYAIHRRPCESPYIADRYLPRLITRREWRVSFAPLSAAERVESSNAEG
jgi:hypothetical protein